MTDVDGLRTEVRGENQTNESPAATTNMHILNILKRPILIRHCESCSPEQLYLDYEKKTEPDTPSYPPPTLID